MLGPDPIPEDAALGVVSHRPGSLYALTRQSCEHLALLWRDLYELSTISFRLQPSSAAMRMLLQAFPGG